MCLQQGLDSGMLLLQALKASECLGSYSGILRKSCEVDTKTPLFRSAHVYLAGHVRHYTGDIDMPHIFRQGVGGFILDKYKDLELTGRLVPP